MPTLLALLVSAVLLCYKPQETSMTYHMDLWATSVFYQVASPDLVRDMRYSVWIW